MQDSSNIKLTEDQRKRQERLLADRIQIIDNFTTSYAYIEKNPSIAAEKKAEAKALYERYNSVFACYFDDVISGKAGIKVSNQQQAKIDEFKKQYNSEAVSQTGMDAVARDKGTAMSEIVEFTVSKNNKMLRNNGETIITFDLAASCTKVSDISQLALPLIKQDIEVLEKRLAIKDKGNKDFVSDENRVSLETNLKDARKREKFFRSHENSNKKVSELSSSVAAEFQEVLGVQAARFNALSTIAATEDQKQALLNAGSKLSVYKDVAGSYKFKGEAFKKTAEELYGSKAAEFMKEVAALGKIANPELADQKMKELVGFSSKDLGTAAATQRTSAEYDLNSALDQKYPIYPDQLGNFYSAVFAATGLMTDPVEVDKWQKKVAETSVDNNRAPTLANPSAVDPEGLEKLLEERSQPKDPVVSQSTSTTTSVPAADTTTLVQSTPYANRPSRPLLNRGEAKVFKPLSLDKEYSKFLADQAAAKQSTTSQSTASTVTDHSEKPAVPRQFGAMKLNREEFKQALAEYQAEASLSTPSSPSQQLATETTSQSKPSSLRSSDSIDRTPPQTMNLTELQLSPLFIRQASQESLPDMFPSSAVSSPASSGTTTPKGDRFPALRPAEFQAALKEVENLRQLEGTGKGTERQAPPRPDRPYPYEAPVVSSTSTASVKSPAIPARLLEEQKSVAPASSTGEKPLSKVQELIRQREAAAKADLNSGGHGKS